MPERKLAPDEADYIRSYVQEGIDAGETEKQICSRRQELFDLFEGTISIGQIRATTAWIKIRAKKNLNSAKIAKEDKQDGVSDDIDFDNITGQDRTEIRGEDMDYNTLTKIKWREKMSVFIDKNFPKEGREKMRVLCLPGKECLEIPMYLSLGFDPKNIIGVEGGKKETRSIFEQNAIRLGIDYRLGKLEDLLQSDPNAYDVVSLDFHGYFHDKHMDILENVLLAKKAVIMMNSMKSRENEQTKIELQTKYLLMHDKFGLQNKHWNEKKAIIDQLENGEMDAPDLSEARNSILAQIICVAIGSSRRENLRSKEDFDYWSDAGLTATSDLATEIQELILRSGVSSERRSEIFAQQLRMLHASGIGNRHRPIKLEQYYYTSDTGSPFISEFITLERPEKEYHAARYTIKFLSECVLHRISMLKAGDTSKCKFIIRDKNLFQVERPAGFRTSDSINYIVRDKTVSSIEVRTLLRDMNTQWEIYNNQIWIEEMDIRKSLDENY
ncbi:MAG: hypothetical protein KBD00_00515 [Candidatus Peribacteraceae bacterium]|nr:hypothetical protein [Candidatus Peribacteraceae bacterium]